MNQSVSNLYPDGFYSHERCTKLTSPETNHERFLLMHKNGHVVPLKKRARTYNSMAYGLAALIELEPDVAPLSCQLLVDNSKKIIASSSSLISLLDIDLKTFEGDACTHHFFLEDPTAYKGDTSYPIGQVIKADFITPATSPYNYSIHHEPYQGIHLI
jgi:hypothetical protein